MTDAAEWEVLDVLDRFCAGFAERDVEAILSLFAPDPGIAVITSEQPLLRGIDELKRFVERYAAGEVTYSWEWHWRHASGGGGVAWLLAEGTETAAGPDGEQSHPYRMTMVLRRAGERWLLLQVHGSSPH